MRRECTACRAIWWNWSAATTSRERPPRSRCSKRRWINGERSPTTTAGSPRSARGCPRRRCTASRRSTTTCSSRAGSATCACAPARRASPPPATRTSTPSSDALGLSSASAREDRSVSLAETVCLGYCHASPAVRDGDTIDAGPGAIERLLANASQPAPEPVFDQPARRAGPHPPRRLVRLRAGAARTPEDAARGGQGRRRQAAAAAPASPPASSGSSRARPKGERKVIVANGDEGDPGSYIDKLLMEDNPHLLLEGLALAGYAVGAATASSSPAPSTRAPSPRWTHAIDEARAHGHLGERFDITVVEGAGSYVVGEETALLRCLQGLRGTVSARPPFPAERGVHGLPTVVNNVETLCNIPFIAAHGAEAYRALSPGRDARLEDRLLQRALRQARRLRGPVRDDDARAVRGRRRRHGQRRADQGAADRRPARRHPARLQARHGLRLRAARRPRAAWSATAGSSPSRSAPTCARWPSTCCTSAPPRAAASASRAGSGSQRAHAMFESDDPVDRAKLEQLLETLELGSLCAHGGGMPAPIRSLLAHFPEELGLDVITFDDRRRGVTVPPGTTILDAARAAGTRSRRSASTSARPRSAPAACAWSASRARPARSPPARRSCARA